MVICVPTMDKAGANGTMEVICSKHDLDSQLLEDVAGVVYSRC